jgi:hypothetical protein
LISLAATLVVGLGAVAAGFGVRAGFQRVRGDRKTQDLESDRQGFQLSAAQRIALWVAVAGLSTLSRNWRAPVWRLLGLRRVDEQTGGPVSVRSALVGEVFDEGLRVAIRRLFRSRTSRDRRRLAALRPQMKAIERQYADDPPRRQRALLDFYKANQVDPLASCAWQSVPGSLSSLLVALWSPGGRSIRDRVTGTVVVVDP